MMDALSATQRTMTAHAAAHGARWAIYYAPEAASALSRFGCDWLGRDAQTGAVHAGDEPPGIDSKTRQALTAAPRRYGFHATLKAPFRLRTESTPADLVRACRAFARTQRAVAIGQLEVGEIDGFIALLPTVAPDALGSFAFACVRAFDALRAAPTPAELQRRLAHGLTPRQLALLDGWGYPYVDDEYRFHMTLTDRVSDAERDWLLPALRERYLRCGQCEATIDALCLFVEPAPGEDFRLVERFVLGV